MQVQVMTHPIDPPDARGSVKTINWNDSSDRRWLMNHLHHCMMNHKLVTLSPESNRTQP